MRQQNVCDMLPEKPQKTSGPATCLGMTFENDEARRAHFTEELRKKLQDPEFRKIEGFPIPIYFELHLTWLKEFEEYKEVKKLKVFRLKAVRAGFKKAWQERDYAVILAVADKIPNNVLGEDPKLLMWYDQTVTRMGGE